MNHIAFFSHVPRKDALRQQSFSASQHHLDCGRHERALEHETLLDRAVYGYAQRLQEQSGGAGSCEQQKRLLKINRGLPVG